MSKEYVNQVQIRASQLDQLLAVMVQSWGSCQQQLLCAFVTILEDIAKDIQGSIDISSSNSCISYHHGIPQNII